MNLPRRPPLTAAVAGEATVDEDVDVGEAGQKPQDVAQPRVLPWSR